MSDQGSPAPRRALPPLDDVDDLDDEFDDNAGLDAPTPRRRLWEPSTPPSPEGDPPPSTLIPPPTAVVPPVEHGSTPAGRRFSAADLDDLDDDLDSPQPRRSALSPLPLSPESPDTLAESDVTPESGTSALPVPAPPPAAQPPADRIRSTGSSRRRRGFLAGGVAVLAVVGVVAAVLLNPPRPEIPAAEPTVEPATLVMSPADATPLRDLSAWTAAPTVTEVGPDTPQPSCLPASADLEPRPASSTISVLESTQGGAAAVLHEMDAYATPEEAALAFDQRRQQLGACELTTALTGTAYSVTGLGDEAVALDFVVQSETPDQHHVVISRVGSLVNIVDTSQAGKAFGADAVALALARAEARQCAAVEATCPSSKPAAKATPPLPTEPLGWLAKNDLPRLTPGQGVWRGTDMESVELPSSTCDAVENLNRVEGATSVKQRTYLLADDTRATANFGVDQGVYTFPDSKAAAGFATKVASAISDCPDRMPTAAVKQTGALDAAGAKGTSFLVSQKLPVGTTTYRVTIAARGDRVLYLFSNPGKGFDFSDNAWGSVSRRAAERLAQLP